MPLSTVPIRLPAGSTSADACVVAPVCASQQGGTLPSVVPCSDTLWRALLGGYSYTYVSGLPCSHPDKPVLLARAQRLWDLVRAEALVSAWDAS